MMAGLENPWTLSAGIANLSGGPLKGQVDTSSPQLGIEKFSIAGRVIAESLFEIEISGLKPSNTVRLPQAEAGTTDSKLLESYVRNPDLFVKYTPSHLPSVTGTTYWRLGQFNDERGTETFPMIEIIHSISTDQLDQLFELKLTSRIISHESPAAPRFVELPVENSPGPEARPNVTRVSAKNRVEAANACCLVSASPDYQLAIAVAPADLEEQICEPIEDGQASSWRLTHLLKPTPLEKGVIRRYRAAAIVLPAGDADRHAQAWYREFLSQAPELTT